MSGEGAAVNGGRFNAKGVPALYLALTPEGMLAEASHGFAHRFDPLTICTYNVDVDGLTDLRTAATCAAAGVRPDDLACAWAYEAACGRTPVSWKISRDLIDGGASGVMVPSFARGARPGATNLVLWRWGADLPHKVLIHDPSGRLPKDQASWS